MKLIFSTNKLETELKDISCNKNKISHFIPKKSFPKDPIIYFGCFEKHFLNGNIGPTIFTKFSVIQSKTNEIPSERGLNEGNCFLSLLP
jgi:hypothetical protein